jgi:DNA-directed RNA polymerase specialized sigma24 family protein
MNADASTLSVFVQTNDCDLLMQLYNRHYDKLAKWIRLSYNVDQSIADNVVIQAIEYARDHHDEFDGESFRDWLYSIAGNCVAGEKQRIEQLRRDVAWRASRLAVA